MIDEGDEQEYQVESIVTHLEYEEAFELRGYILFNPSTGNGSTHSKYVYLDLSGFCRTSVQCKSSAIKAELTAARKVKWVGYDESDNTWEPEENLVDCTELLTRYKEKHGLPAYHETFYGQFNWKEPTFTMTLTEVQKRAYKNSDFVNSASQLLRDPPTKRRKMKNCIMNTQSRIHEDITGATYRTIFTSEGATDDGQVDKCSDESDYHPQQKPKNCSTFLHGTMTVNTAFGSKKRASFIKNTKPERKKRGAKRRVTSDGHTAKKSGRKPRAESVTGEKKEKNTECENRVELVRYILNGVSLRSRSPFRRLLNTRRYSSAERLPENWFKAVQEESMEGCLKMTSERMSKLITANFVNYKDGSLDQRKMTVCMREKQELDGEKRQYRVVGSSLLKKLLKENGCSLKLPVPESIVASSPRTTNAYNDTVITAKDKELQTNATVLFDAVSSKQVCSLLDLRKYAHEFSLADSTDFLKTVRKRDVKLTDDELQIIALTYAELSYKIAVCLLRTVEDDGIRLGIVKDLIEKVRIIGNSNLPRPQRLEEPSSSLACQLIESDLKVGGWFEAISHCSSAHWKCRLLHQLITLCPAPEVFLDPSSPFSVKQFLYCMRYGAHCQKLVFVVSGVPLTQERTPFDFFDISVDCCHIAAMQSNHRYLLKFIANGFDTNSLTAKQSSTRLNIDLTVPALLEKLITSSKTSGEVIAELTDETRSHLLKNLAVITDWESSLRRFIRFAVEEKLKSDERCEVAFDRAVTPVHTIRVSACKPDEIRVRTSFFENISTPILTRILNMVHCEKAAVVLCIYSVSIEPIIRSYSDGCPLPLCILHKIIPDCRIEEAVLEDTFSSRRLVLTRDESSSSGTEWYFVLSSEALGHMSTYAMTLHLKLDAPPGSLFLAQFVLVSRLSLDDAPS